MVNRKHLENTHQFGGSSQLPLPVSLYCFLLAIILLKIYFLLAALAVTALINLKIQLCIFQIISKVIVYQFEFQTKGTFYPFYFTTSYSHKQLGCLKILRDTA